MSRTIGLDVSFWQDYNGTPLQIDFKKAYAYGARFAFTKLSQGLRADEDVDYNCIQAAIAKLLVGGYHFVDYRKRADEQIDFAISLYKKYGLTLGLALDVEKYPRSTWGIFPNRSNWLKWLYTAFAKLDDVGIKGILYTNKNNIKILEPIPEWLLKQKLWIAQYPNQKYVDVNAWHPYSKPWDTEDEEENVIPGWTFWQFSDRGDGKAYGMESKQVDVNFFNGTLDELKKYAGVVDGPVVDPDPGEIVIPGNQLWELMCETDFDGQVYEFARRKKVG